MKKVFLICAVSLATPATAQQAVGTEFAYSSDSDGTELMRMSINLDLRHVNQSDYLGISLEQSRYRPMGDAAETSHRIFLRAAGGTDWQWRAKVGTDGHTVLGSVALNDNSPFRKEFFVERDIIETRQGLTRGLYSTFAGAAIDLPVDDRNVMTALVGVQEFGERNVRLHLRGNYIHVVKPEWGLSAQLRGRYLTNSHPREADYYSPNWFAEALPVVQMRRHIGGWQLVGAAGLGLQRDAETNWRQARYTHARFRSPDTRNWFFNGSFTYTNSPLVGSVNLTANSYVNFNFGITRKW
jgi:hypothetical protein